MFTRLCFIQDLFACVFPNGWTRFDLSASLGLLGCAILATPFAVAAQESGDWPGFLGPRRDGTSAETGLLDKWPTNGPPIVWHKQIGTGYGAPAIRGNALILHHRIGNEELVERLEADSGKSIWHYGYASRFVDPYGYNNGPRSSPLVTADRCYTFGAEGKLLCLDLNSGKPVWQRDTAADWNVPQAFFGVGSSPVLEGERLLVMVGGQPNSGVVAFDPKTGKTIWESVGEKNWQGQPMIGWTGDRKVQWQSWEKQASYATPVVATIHGQRHLLAFMRQGLVSLNPTNGEVNFSFWFRSPVTESVNAMNPVVVNDLIFLSGAYYKIGSVLLKVRPDGKAVETVWRSTVLEIHWNTPVYRDGYLYAFTGRNEPDAHFRCIDLKAGKTMWDRDEHWTPHSTPTPDVYGRGSCLLADGKLFVLGEGGLLGLFALNPTKPEEIARWQVPQLHYPCWAGPILSRQKLYLRSEDHLVCIDVAQHK